MNAIGRSLGQHPSGKVVEKIVNLRRQSIKLIFDDI